MGICHLSRHAPQTPPSHVSLIPPPPRSQTLQASPARRLRNDVARGKVPRLPMRWRSANEVALNFDLGENNMPDDLANKGPHDRTRISLLEPHRRAR
jgi:hypothetical protein